MTLFGEDDQEVASKDNKQQYFRFLHNQYPQLLEKYKAMYGSGFYPSWKYQNELKRRTELLCHKYGIRNSIT
jgi:hypothetical protein